MIVAPTIERRSLRAVDLAALAIAVTLGLFLVSSSDAVPGVRMVAALVFTTFVPGWTAARLAGFGFRSVTFAIALILSVTAMIITSFLMVNLVGWEWRVAGLGWVVASLVGLAAVLGGRTAAERGWRW